MVYGREMNDASDLDALRTKYQVLNGSYRKKFVFQLSRGGGYCAEMIHMIQWIQSCLMHQVQFCLGNCHKPRGFAVDRGWSDYFNPVFPEVQGRLIPLLNRPLFPFNRVPLGRMLSSASLKLLYGNNLYMFDNPSYKYIEGALNQRIGIGGGYWAELAQLIRTLWCYRDDVKDLISSYNYEIARSFEEDYVAVHVRRGDKIIESPYVKLEKYAEIIYDNGLQNMPLFLSSDDSKIKKELNSLLGNNVSIYFHMKG